ncbi:MAG TPA: hypothetical protein VHI13_16795 [Candidatus Kapabacteria bacterium]|nr:hypothetical protein [Candidatus Kapabacteria bacterium]
MGKWGDFFRKLAGDRAEELKADIETAEKELDQPAPQPENKPAPKPEEKPKTDEKPVPTDTTDISKLIAEAVTAGNKPLADRLDAIEKASSERASAELTAKVESALKEHLGVRWPESKREDLKKMLTDSYDNTMAMLAMMPKNPAVNRDVQAEQPQQQPQQAQQQSTADRYKATKDAAVASIQAAYSAGLPNGSAQE